MNEIIDRVVGEALGNLPDAHVGGFQQHPGALDLGEVDVLADGDAGLFFELLRQIVFRIAHQAAKAAIKALYPDIKVGVTLSMHDLQALPSGESFAEAAWDEEFRHYLPYIQNDDFLGVQNYTRTQYGPEGQLPCPAGAELTQMDYEFYPEALENVLRRVHEDFKGDLIVTENGVAVSDDSRRVEFIRRALQGVENCVNDGILVKGYMYWSLMDNFEWQKGYSMTFGLIAVDRATQERRPKESLTFLGRQRKAISGL